MAIFLNVVPRLSVTYLANQRPVQCVIDTGTYTTHECGIVMPRGVTLQPIQSSGSTAPTGPQRWPL